jgi:hypothetical protein
MDSGRSASFLSLRSSELLGGLSHFCRCIRADWTITGIYLLNSQYVLVRISKLKRKSEVRFLLKTPDSDRAFRKTYGRLKNADHINKEAAVLMRGDERLAAENKILRRKVEGLREC